MSIRSLFVQRSDDPEASQVLQLARSFGYPIKDVQIERVVMVESTPESKNGVDIDQLLPLFVNPLYEQWAFQSQLNADRGPIVEIAYQKAVTDPETPSIFDAASALEAIANLAWVRLARRYQLNGATPEQAHDLSQEFLYNAVVQEVIPENHAWSSLYPHGQPEPLKTISFIGLSDEELTNLSYEKRWNAPLEQLKAIQAQEVKIGRPFTDAEIEMLVQWWCDHCYHTTWKSLGLLQVLQNATRTINHPEVVSAYSDNAGGFTFYEDEVALIKGETHNHPSAIATRGGILTKHGGVIRDIIFFGRGGYPFGGTTIMGIMDPRLRSEQVPQGALHPRRILLEAISGTADYLNPMGIPMMKAMYRIHEGFPKCFALGHTIGIIPERYALKEKPEIGDLIFLIGGRTGRDGIHGATGSSGSLTAEVLTKWSAEVQIGHPITERKFTTAIPMLRDSGCIRTCTDLGAGGISCAVGEIVEGIGGQIDISTVHLKDSSLADWEILLSESQERGVLIVPPEKEKETIRILNLMGIEFSILGRTTGDNTLTVYNGERLVAKHDLDFVWKGCPIPTMTVKEPEMNLPGPSKRIPQTESEWEDAGRRVLSHFHVADQSAAIFQYDQTVQGRTVIGPLGGLTGKMPTNLALLAPLRGKPYGLGLTIGWKPFYGEIDPAQMVELAHLEAVSYAAAAGASLGSAFFHSNYYTPKLTEEVGWHLKRMVERQAEVNITMGCPTIAGKDSSSGTWKGKDGRVINVPYTAVMALAFKMPDVRQVITKPFKKAGHALVWVGPCPSDNLGGSVYLDCYNERGDTLPTPNLKECLQNYAKLHQFHETYPDLIVAGTAISDGGLWVRLFEMAYGSGLGAQIDLNSIGSGRPDGILFGEAIGSLVLEVADFPIFKQACQNLGLSFKHFGCVTNTPKLTVIKDCRMMLKAEMDELTAYWEETFKEVV